MIGVPFAVFALLVSLILPAPFARGACDDVRVIGIRGSGQPPGFGEQVEPVVEAVGAAMTSTGRTVESVPLEYPALSLADSFGLALFTGEYEASVVAGAEALLADLEATADRCPDTEFVLVGYSQGAQVIKAALADSVPLRHIAGLILLADPTRDHRQAGVARLGDPTVERPGAFGAVPVPDHLRALTVDVCAPGDGVCERGRDSLFAHTRGYDDAAPGIVSFLVAELDDRLRGPALR